MTQPNDSFAEFIRGFVEQASASIAVFDSQSRVVAVSGRWRREHGVEGEVEGQPMADAVPGFPEFPERLRSALARALAGGSVDGEEERFTAADGSVRWLEWRTRPWRGPDGAVRGAVVSTRDVGSRRAERLALRESEALQRAIVDASMDAIVVIDQGGIVQSINPAARKLFGYEPAELVGQNVKVLMPGHFREEHDTYISNYLRTGQRKIIGVGRVVVALRRDGSSFPVELAVNEAATSGGDRVFVGFIRDLSPIREADRRAEKLRAELVHANRLGEMGQVVSNLAHEVNQPLGAIANYASAGAQLAARDGVDIRQLRGVLEKIEAQAARATGIVRRVRAFVDRREMERAPCDLRSVVEESLGLAFFGSGRDVRFSLDLGAAPARVNVDRVQIQQVLVNLLSNAADAMEGQPDKTIAIGLSARDGRAAVAIADNGPGVDPSVADKLFDSFVTTKPMGMGVGLAICRDIAESHGGGLVQSSNTPRGAVFTFWLPLLDEGGQPEAA